MIIYFTGTGNSRHLAQQLAKILDDDCISAVSYIKENKVGDFHSEKAYIFVCPVYAWQMPHIFEEFLNKSTFSGSTDCYFVMNCGDEIGNAEKGVKAFCARKGFQYRGVIGIKMPENYIAIFRAPDEETEKRIITAADKKIARAAETIRHREAFPPCKITTIDKLKSGIVNKTFYKMVISDKKFHATERCTGCGNCTKSCMLNNISIKAGKPLWGGHCTHCMACICGCSEEAIEYGKHTEGLRRYFLKD
ncbi:EFR1 family ferrodoxin [Anaerovoracaceae bacterium 41-7]